MPNLFRHLYMQCLKWGSQHKAWMVLQFFEALLFFKLNTIITQSGIVHPT